jgi:hypothetical protein
VYLDALRKTSTAKRLRARIICAASEVGNFILDLKHQSTLEDVVGRRDHVTTVATLHAGGSDCFRPRRPLERSNGFFSASTCTVRTCTHNYNVQPKEFSCRTRKHTDAGKA